MSEADRFGLDEETNPNHLAGFLAKFVPQRLARRGLGVRVSTDRDRYAVGDTVVIEIELRNRLPVPVSVATPAPRLWGWTVDGHLEASDEPRHDAPTPGTLDFRGRERKRFVRRWDGRIKRVGTPTRWEQQSGTVEVGAFVAVAGDRPRDSTTIVIE